MKETSFFHRKKFHSSFIFKENHVFIKKKDKSSEIVVIVEEELYSVAIDGTGNLKDSSKLMFTDEECGNLQGTTKLSFMC